jgi:hypothetical protein
LRYSPSKINTYNQCPQKFKYKHIDKISLPEPSKEHSERGSLFHEVIEYDLKGNILSDFKSILKYEVLSQEKIDNTIEEAKSFITSSRFYNMLKTYSNIELEKAIYLDQNLLPLDKEYKDTDNCLMSGKCDVMAYDNKILHVYDWKTGGKNRDTIRRFPKNTMQLDIYCIWGINIFLDFESSKIGYIYVDHNFPVLDIYNKNQIVKIRNKILKNIEKIEKDTNYAKKFNALCDWCEYKNMCLKFTL